MEAASLAPALSGGPPFNIKESAAMTPARCSPDAQDPHRNWQIPIACDAQACSQRKVDAFSRCAGAASLQKFDS
jgi:hypothetical protein